RRGRGRPRVGRVVPAAHPRDPGGSAGRRPARCDPALPHVLRDRALDTAGIAAVKILVGTDRSETATRAVEWAAEMARRYEAELVVLQVGGGREELEPYVAEVAPGGRALVVPGDEPSAAIVAAAEREKIDVLVVGNLGMS